MEGNWERRDLKEKGSSERKEREGITRENKQTGRVELTVQYTKEAFYIHQ